MWEEQAWGWGIIHELNFGHGKFVKRQDSVPAYPRGSLWVAWRGASWDGWLPIPTIRRVRFQVCTTPLFSVKQDTITGKESANWLSSRVTRVRDVTLTCIPSEVQPFVCV